MAEQTLTLANAGDGGPSWFARAISAVTGIFARSAANDTAQTEAIISLSTRALASGDPSPSSEPKRSAFAAPKQDEYREIPSSYAFTEWDRVGQVRAILRELEQGQFQRASLLSVLQERDDRLSGCWDIRTGTLLGTPIEFEPALIDGQVTEETAEIADAAEVDWPKMFPEGSLDRLFKWGVDLGLGVGEMVVAEDEETGRWVPRLKVWHTQWVWWNWGTESYWINTAGAYDEDGNPSSDGAGVIELPRVDRDVYSDGHWILYCPGGFRYAFQRGKIRATAMLHLRRQWDMRDVARYNEVYGLMIRKATVPSGATEPDKDRFATSIRNLGSESTVQCPVDTEGKGFDIDIVGPPTGSSGSVFGEDLHYLDECIGNIILGQQASGEKRGGIGNGEDAQNENVRQDILEKDARIYGVLKEQFLSWWCLWNFGDRRLCPTPHALVEPQEDKGKTAGALKGIAEAGISLKSLFGPAFDLGAYAAEHGINLHAPGEVPDEAPAIEGPDADSAEEPEPTKLAVRTLTSKQRRKLGYVDKLSDAATRNGAAIMRPDVADIRRLIADAKSPDELKAALIDKYRSMDPRRFADLVAHAQIMAELDGRHDVLDNF